MIESEKIENALRCLQFHSSRINCMSLKSKWKVTESGYDAALEKPS